MNWNIIKSELEKHFDQSKILDGIKVKVYFNLHKNLFSVCSGQGDNYGKLLFHSDNLILDDVRFSVGQKGRDRVLKEKKKNVHAFCYGTLKQKQFDELFYVEAISYNPYKAKHFYYVNSSQQIKSTDYLIMNVINNKGKMWTGAINEKKTSI